MEGTREHKDEVWEENISTREVVCPIKFNIVTQTLKINEIPSYKIRYRQ